MIAEEKQFTENGALSAYLTSLITAGATEISVTVIAKSWYLILYKEA